ncbi:MAG: aldehyde dehydrogenase family protein, partial [Pseudomonadota bacterium]
MNEQSTYASYDAHLATLAAAKETWAATSIEDRISILREVKASTGKVAEEWALLAAREKRIPKGSPLAGEEWLSGPYAVVAACDALITTLEGMENRAFLKPLPKRYTATGQLAVEVFPANIWDRLLLSGLHAEVWMQPGVSEVALPTHTASAYDAKAIGKVSVVLGAGNIAAIAPLDCFHKLIHEHQVVLLKMNPVNDYLTEVLEAALRPLIDRDALRIVRGDGAAGAYLTDHPLVDEIHITGAAATHDLIVWGEGEESTQNKAKNTPKNRRRITSELGAVCPVIVIPGPWSPQDIRFQAAHIATMKLHNSGFNCVACQVLVMPSDWPTSERLLKETKKVISKNTRVSYYPGAADRVADFASQGDGEQVARGEAL